MVAGLTPSRITMVTLNRCLMSLIARIKVVSTETSRFFLFCFYTVIATNYQWLCNH